MPHLTHPICSIHHPSTNNDYHQSISSPNPVVLVVRENRSLDDEQRQLPSLPSYLYDLLTLGSLVPLPGGGEVGATLAAGEGGGHGRRHRVQVQDPVDALLQAGQVDELRVRRVRDEMHFRRRRFWWWDLQD